MFFLENSSVHEFWVQVQVQHNLEERANLQIAFFTVYQAHIDF
jgi:hypothetical protein